MSKISNSSKTNSNLNLELSQSTIPTLTPWMPLCSIFPSTSNLPPSFTVQPQNRQPQIPVNRKTVNRQPSNRQPSTSKPVNRQTVKPSTLLYSSLIIAGTRCALLAGAIDTIKPINPTIAATTTKSRKCILIG